MEVWEIVGGSAETGGIIVKEGVDLGSPKCSQRIATGSLVQQLELVGERLHFKRLTGSGPDEGWVSTMLMGKPLCVKTEKRPPTAEDGDVVSGYEVLAYTVELYAEPVFSMDKGKMRFPKVNFGDVLWGFPEEINGHIWLQLTEEAVSNLEGAAAHAGTKLWAPVSVDLSMVGIGMTLEVLSLKEQRRLPKPEPPAPEPKAEEPPASTPPPVDEPKPAEPAKVEVPAEPVIKEVESSGGGGMWGDLADACDEKEDAVRAKVEVPAEPVIKEVESSGGGGMWGDLADACDEKEDAVRAKVEVPAEPVIKEVESSGGGGMWGDLADACDEKEDAVRVESEQATTASDQDEQAAPAEQAAPEEPQQAAPAPMQDYSGPRGMWEDLADLDDNADEPLPQEDSGAGFLEALADLMDEYDREVWQVVGGEERGGIMVKDGALPNSKRLKGRLSTGALVQMIDIDNDRMKYKLLQGEGPEEGWVAMKLGGRDQLVRTEAAPEEPEPASWTEGPEDRIQEHEAPARPGAPAQQPAERLPVAPAEREKAATPASAEGSPKAADVAEDSPKALDSGDKDEGGETQELAPERVPVPLGPMGQFMVASCGWVPPTREELVEMLKDFVAAYSAEEFQLECRTLPAGPAGAQAKQDLLWSLQRPIIGKYGFPQTRDGGAACVGECLQHPETKKDPEISELQQEVFTLLLDPKIQDKLRKEKEARLAAEAKSKETPEEIRKRQMEKERKEEQTKELTKKAAVGAETVLGVPVKYKVLSSSPLFEGPFFASPVMGELEVGHFVRGFPGSRTWVKMDVTASAYDEQINPEIGCWMPSSNRIEGKNEVLEAVWSVISLKEASTRAMRVSWPGLDTPPSPYQVEYFVEWKANLNNIAYDGQGLTPNKNILLTGMPPGSEISMRVSARVNSPVRDVAGEIVLPGPWHIYDTLPGDEEDQLALGDEQQGEGLYEITAKSVELYPEPNTAKDEAFTLKKGAKITGIPRKIIREDWLQLTEQTLPPPANREIGPGDSYWILLEDSPVTRLEDRAPAVVNEGDETWRVVHPRVVVRDEPSINGQVLGFRSKGAIVKGVSEEFQEGWLWLRCQYRANSSAPLQDGYMLCDGAPLGLPKLLSIGKEVTENDLLSWKASLSRPMPPRPLTASWMAAYGGVPSLYSVREELLPASEDVGMNSQCTLVYTAPPGGGSEVGLVAKRATVKDDLATKDTAEQEYRFYAEMVYPPPGESQPPEGDPLMLAGAVRVPRCHCVNFLAAGSKGNDDEEEDDLPEGALPMKGRNQYFLLLEMFSKPYWVSMNPANGINMDQAMSAVASLAKLHLACQKKEVMDKLSWLPLTIFDLEKKFADDHVDGQDDMVSEFKQMAELNPGVLRQLLPEAAFAAADRMAQGGIDEVASALSEPPLTFCHGDYRTENLRFGAWGSPPEVGTFDFGLSCRCKAAYDLAYFIILSQPPHIRRERDWMLAWRYLEVIMGGEPTQQGLHELFREIRIGSLGVLALTLMTRIAARNAGFYKETRETQTRLLRWVCIAVEDWSSIEVMTDPAAARPES